MKDGSALAAGGLPPQRPEEADVSVVPVRSWLAVCAASLSMVALVVTPVRAHPPGSDAWDGSYEARDTASIPVVTGDPDVPIARQTDNVTFVAHVPVGPTSDLHFQRREGRQVLAGEVVDRRLDLVVAGGTATPGVSVFDITDPTAPVVLTTISCGGFHSDVAVYENWLVQGWDGASRPCEEDEPADPDELDLATAGLRIYDFTDPARPRLVRHYTRADGIPAGVHNITVNGDAGLVYLNMAEFNSVDPPWGFVDLDDPELPLHLSSIRDWSPTAADGCHDAGVAPARKMLACAGITATYIWDISDPRQPVEVAVIPNPAISIHHGARWAPDEQLLVLGDELVGAANPTPCTGAGSDRTPVGATWFYDASTAAAPVLLGTFSVTDTEGEYCTSHFYGFQRDTTLMPVGWYDAGIEIVDYAPVAGGTPGAPTSHAVFEPQGGAFFSAYAWHGFVYGSSFEYGAEGGIDDPARGLWIIEVEGIDDVEPLPTDEGIVWGRWTEATSGVPADVPTGPLTPLTAALAGVDARMAGSRAVSAPSQLPATGGGMAVGALFLAIGVAARRRRT